MCSRYVQLPSGEIIVVPLNEMRLLPRGSYILSDPTANEAYRHYLKERFQIDEWDGDACICYNLAPQNVGNVIKLIDGKRVLENSIYGFKRSWGAGHNFRFDNLLPETEDFMELGLPTYQSSDPRRQSQNRFGNPQFYPAFSQGNFCLVLMKGFIEFDSEEVEVQLKTKTKKVSQSIPYYTGLVSGDLIAAAGLYEMQADGQHHAIGTTGPNGLMKVFHHDRFPVFLNSLEKQDLWLRHDVPVEVKINELSLSEPEELFHSVRVSTKINNSRYKEADSLTPQGGYFQSN